LGVSLHHTSSTNYVTANLPQNLQEDAGAPANGSAPHTDSHRVALLDAATAVKAAILQSTGDNIINT
jgi:hypothetical protein